ncbi:DNA-binding protein [Candidatus Mycoplasma haematobovis]|uniref:DNA-binding protein n=1 Tax=Candidatus Mycoplasma haematobovis TaxID=432608 RepID=A0A1A9QCY7_9MOLU|nr:HU family DNA-binding protein [Candidatus Mycoplasma haematobovis]OAL10337.1 DNA-binding protein [Candidatus Mycoplasma haematobovis]
MNKKELISEIAKRSGVSQKDAQSVLNAFQRLTLENLKNDKEVVFLDLGKFKVVERAARKGVNPATKQPIDIPAKKKPSLVASRKFKAFVEGSEDIDNFSY